MNKTCSVQHISKIQGSRNWVAAVALQRRRMALKKKMKTPISIFPPKREYFAPKRAQITQLTNNSGPIKNIFQSMFKVISEAYAP